MFPMGWILDILYFLGFLVALPVLAVKSLRTGKYRRDLSGRLGHVSPEVLAALAQTAAVNRRLLIHCVSVGELFSIGRLVEQLLELSPDLTIIISNITDTGTQRASALYGSRPDHRVLTVRYPLDLSFAVRRFLDAIEPDMIIFVELETWPNFIFAAARRKIPLWIINGRITQRSFNRYRIVRLLMAAMLRRIEWFGVQTDAMARRFTTLGAAAERVVVLPTLKYDTADFVDKIPGDDVLAAALGITGEHQLLVAGSIGPGEEEKLLNAYKELQEQWPTLRLAIAPRKPEHVRRVIAAIRQRNLTPVLRSQRPDLPTDGPPQELQTNEVVVLNTLGELKKLYSIAYSVFSGRSMVNMGGSDMIEVAALAKPCFFGPYTYNFTDAVELLLSKNAATCVWKHSQFVGRIQAWLAAPDRAAAMGRRARDVLQTQRGSTQRYAQRIAERLETIRKSQSINGAIH
jgi:3-deoxy-D-manno-octulosonic-acid transferase